MIDEATSTRAARGKLRSATNGAPERRGGKIHGQEASGLGLGTADGAAGADGGAAREVGEIPPRSRHRQDRGSDKPDRWTGAIPEGAGGVR